MIEFADWNTPFRHGTLHIVSVEYGTGACEIVCHRPYQTYRLNSDQPENAPALKARVLDTESNLLYEISFASILGFRLLDEHGLLELWDTDAYKARKPGGTFLVRNHSWHKESPLTFACGMDGEWSYMLATDNDCVEVVSAAEPAVRSLGEVIPVTGPP